MKKLIAVFLSVIIAAAAVLSLSGCFGYSYIRTRQGPAMWIVEDGSGNRCYLFGSIHIGKDDGRYPFADVIEDAFSYCDHLAVEYDVVKEEKRQAAFTPQESVDYMMKFAYTDGTDIKDHLSERVYTLMCEAVASHEGAYNGQYDGFVPALWYSVLSEYSTEAAGYSSDYGVDRYFINKAYETGKGILEIESDEEQLAVMLSIDDRIYESMLESELADMSGSGLKYADTVYFDGDADRMSYTVAAERTVSPYADSGFAAAFEEYDRIMCADRNKKMADAVIGYLAEGKRVFVVVGYAHMFCDDGILALLQQSGLKVYRK